MLVLVYKRDFTSSNKEGEFVKKAIFVELPKNNRKFDNRDFVLSKIDYSKEDANTDQAYYKGRGTEAKAIEDGGYWLIYTKLGA